MVVSENLAYAFPQRVVLDFWDPLEKVTHRHIASLVAVQTYKPLVDSLELLRGERCLMAEFCDLLGTQSLLVAHTLFYNLNYY